MECGADELACHLIDWALNSPYVIKEAFDALDVVWTQAGWHIGQFLREHGEKLIAIASFSFAVWRWLRYREGVLHKRLQDYIRESDVRLEPTAAQVREAILRPGRTAALPQPAFAIELRGILSVNGWRSFLRFSSIETQVERRLGHILKGINHREEIAREATRSLVKQRTQVRLLAGAINAARARREYDYRVALRLDRKALRQFREALQSPGHHRDVHAKECEAFQLLRIGERDRAYQAYIELQEYAQDILDQKTRNIVVARSKRFRAQVNQARVGNARSLNAWTLDDGGIIEALTLRNLSGPYADWGTIEQAETNYVAAWVANRGDFHVQEPQRLADAEQNYGKVLTDDLPRRRFLLFSWQRKLLEEAEAGLRRVERARSGDYDEEWLMV